MSKSTIYLDACDKVFGFQQMGEEFIRKLVINGRAESTHKNYLRQMAKLALHYNKTPLELELGELEEFLYLLIEKGTDSQSSFKHLVYGLKKLYVLFGREELELGLPVIESSKKLPVVLSIPEIKRLLSAPKHLREKVIFALTYDTGMRISEVRNLLLSDIDLDRKQIHIRQSKNKKDRYLPLSSLSVKGIKKHIALNNPKDYLYESPKRKGIPMSKSGVRLLLKEAVVKAKINKDVHVHTLRHTYAVHQLEAGQNIVVLQELLGHSDIQTTMMYLKIAQLDGIKKFGCLEAIYPPVK
jgi:site-specific recombinase XerD